MKFNYIDFWRDQYFENGLEAKIYDPETKINKRNSFIVDECKNLNIIHVGCANHLPLIDEMIKKNVWLHAQLANSAKRCLGLDINKESVKYIREKYGYEDVICADIIKDEITTIKKNEWDIMLIPDVLEHVNNPIEFLWSIKNKYADNIKKIIITVPNAFDYKNIINLIKGKEVINSEHRFWFTPYTLAKIGTLAGLMVDEIYYADPIINYKRGLKAVIMIHPILRLFLIKRILKKYPGFSETIIMTFKMD